jgi:ArsR family transcriptional regulator, arsenate/arsenite/antimonite-responsive transcriptional repressor
MNADRAVAALRALAQETRLEVFRLLAKSSPEGLPAGAISALLAVPAPTMSFHLQQLNHAGLVKKRRASRLLIYAVDAKGMSGLMAYLTEDCCGGRPELCAPKAVCADKTTSDDAVASKKHLKKRKVAADG